MAEQYKIIRITTNTSGGITDANREDIASSAVTFTVSGLTVSQDLTVDGQFNANGDNSFGSLSASTIYSGSTDLYDIFLTTNDGNDITRVQPGTNITTGGTGNFPIINLENDIVLTSINATSISGGTMYSGTTDLGDLIIARVLQSDFNAHTGDTSNPHSVTASQVGAYTTSEADNLFDTKADLSGATFTGQVNASTLSATTLSATTIINNRIGEGLSTGSISGGTLSINAGNNALFDLEGGVGYIVDYTVYPQSTTIVSWETTTGITVDNLATSFATDISIDINGSIVQQDFFTTEELRSVIFLGGLDHSNQTNIGNIFSVQIPSYGIGNSMRDFTEAVGDINITGNIYSANGANLNIDKSVGLLFSYGRAYDTNPNDPSTISGASQTALTFNYIFDNGSGNATVSSDTTDINPNNYDDGSGTLATVATNDYTIQRILYFANSNNTFIQYGNEQFNTLSDAEASLMTVRYTDLVGFTTAMVRGFIIVQEGETVLNTSATDFVTADKFGGIGGVGGSGLANTNFYTTAANLSGTTIFFDRTDTNSAYSVDISSLSGDVTMNGNLTVTGDTTLGGLSATTLSGNTFYSGTTELSTLFGEANTAANAGGGEGIFRDKTGDTINLRSFTSTGDTIVINSSGDTVNFDNKIRPTTNKITVSSGSGGDFQSVKAAIDSITGNTTTNRYCVEIGPGIFVEDTITLKPYIDVSGCYDVTIIEVDSPNKDCIELVGNSELRNLRLRGSTGSTKAVLAVNSSMGPGVTCGVDNVIIGSTDSIFKSNITTGGFAIVTMTNVVNGGSAIFNEGYVLSGGGSTILSLNNSKTSVNSSVNDYFFVSGAGNRVILSDVATLVQSALGGSLGSFARISNGATLDASALGVDGADKVIFNENIGSAATIRSTGFNILNSTNLDIDVQHPGTTGYFNGAADKDKVNINTENTTFSTSYENAGGGFVISGNFFLGDTTSEISNISDLILRGTSLGKYTGGTISLNTGLTIDVSSGDGYLETTENYPQKTAWTGETGISVPSNSIRYVYIDENSNVGVQASQPSLINKITLGRVISDDSSIVSINNTPVTGNHYISDIERYRRNILGTTFESGCVVSENTTSRKLDVSVGKFYFSNNEITPSGGNAISFTPVYNKAAAGQWNYTSTGDTVPNDSYDDGSGTLASLSASSWVKHSIYINGDGDDEKYFLLYGQEQFGSQAEAENGNSPSAPDGWSEGIAILSDIVIEASGSSITTITDKRNFLGTGASAGGGDGASGDHGELTGLGDDDHTQYLLVDGTRAMTGNFDMGGGNITNITNVDGVDVSAHASRHLPNGSDSLSTGAPSDIGTANSVGIANAFARQDHVHNHGSLGGGSLHDTATTSTAGFLSASDKGFLTSGGTLSGSLTITDAFEADSVSATTISGGTFYGDGSNLTGISGGGSSRTTGSTQTTDATPAEVDKIDTIVNNATNIIEVYVKAYSASAAQWGIWKRTLTVTSVAGTVVIREENADVDKTSSGLNANSINFTINGSDIDIDVTGIAATTIDWSSAYEIIL